MILPNNGPYSGLKKALAHLSLTARAELAEDKIVVTVVYPFITLTDFEKNTIKDPSLLGAGRIRLKQRKLSAELTRPSMRRNESWLASKAEKQKFTRMTG